MNDMILAVIGCAAMVVGFVGSYTAAPEEGIGKFLFMLFGGSLLIVISVIVFAVSTIRDSL